MSVGCRGLSWGALWGPGIRPLLFLIFPNLLVVKFELPSSKIARLSIVEFLGRLANRFRDTGAPWGWAGFMYFHSCWVVSWVSGEAGDWTRWCSKSGLARQMTPGNPRAALNDTLAAAPGTVWPATQGCCHCRHRGVTDVLHSRGRPITGSGDKERLTVSLNKC